MTAETKLAPISPGELLGEAHPLLEQLGAPDGLALTGQMATALEFAHIRDLPALRHFLDDYHTRILMPVELPAIVAAHGHAARGEVRELIALDRALAQEQAIRAFAPASCRVGQRQLSKLRPLRDQRVVRRYLEAIEAGEARGWHTIVFGLSLALYSLPLRQGLQHYIGQTTRGFIAGAARSLALTQAAAEELIAEHALRAPVAITTVLDAAALLTPR